MTLFLVAECRPTLGFVDSNIVIYATSHNAKADRAREILSTRPVVSTQVLNEALNVFVRKQRLDWFTIESRLSRLKELLPVVPLTVDTHTLGAQIARKHGFAVYDAMLLAAALEAGCETFWSEDMQDGQVIAGTLTVRNPFADLNDEALYRLTAAT